MWDSAGKVHSCQVRGPNFVLRALGSHGRLGEREGKDCALTDPQRLTGGTKTGDQGGGCGRQVGRGLDWGRGHGEGGRRRTEEMEWAGSFKPLEGRD